MSLLLLLKYESGLAPIIGELTATLDDISVNLAGAVTVGGSAAITLDVAAVFAEGYLGGGYILDEVGLVSYGSVMASYGGVTISDASIYAVTIADAALGAVVISDAGG